MHRYARDRAAPRPARHRRHRLPRARRQRRTSASAASTCPTASSTRCSPRTSRLTAGGPRHDACYTLASMKTFDVRTFGCQMNKHDSERIAGLLEASRATRRRRRRTTADVVVFNTCCVRENADERLYGQVASLKSAKRRDRGIIIAVGGCIGAARRRATRCAAAARRRRLRHAQHRAPARAARRRRAESRRPSSRSLEATDRLHERPARPTASTPWHAWVPITVGCDNFCTYCIVPVRARPRALAHARGHRRRGRAPRRRRRGRGHAARPERQLLRPRPVRRRRASPRCCARVAATGVERIRFTTSHPKDLSDETIEVDGRARRRCAATSTCRSSPAPTASSRR